MLDQRRVRDPVPELVKRLLARELLDHLHDDFENASASERLPDSEYLGLTFLFLFQESMGLSELVWIEQLSIFYFHTVDHAVTVEKVNTVAWG